MKALAAACTLLLFGGCAPFVVPSGARPDLHPLVIYLSGPSGSVINADVADRASSAVVDGGVITLR